MVKNECLKNSEIKTEKLRVWEVILPNTEELELIYSCDKSLSIITKKKYQIRIKEEYLSVSKRIGLICENNCLSTFVATEIIDSQLQSLASERNDLTWKVFFYLARSFLISLLEESLAQNRDLCLVASALDKESVNFNFSPKKNFPTLFHLCWCVFLLGITVIIKSIISSSYNKIS
jgi:hypothetical protein